MCSHICKGKAAGLVLAAFFIFVGGKGERPVDVRKDGIGGAATDSEPVPAILEMTH
jgi:hypothetical protein